MSFPGEQEDIEAVMTPPGKLFPKVSRGPMILDEDSGLGMETDSVSFV